MSDAIEAELPGVPRTVGGGYLFGVPLGDLGWFASLLMGVGAGFGAFMVGTFFGIFGILIYNSAAHQTVDLAISYKRVGIPLGITVMVVALGYLGMLWSKRVFRKA